MNNRIPTAPEPVILIVLLPREQVEIKPRESMDSELSPAADAAHSLLILAVPVEALAVAVP